MAWTCGRPRRGSIGLFTYSTAPRGSVVHTAHLADALVDAGWDVTVYALAKDGGGFFRPLRAGLCLVPAGPAPSGTAALVAQRSGELARYLERHPTRHDLHHAQDCLTASGLLAARARGCDVPLARTIHHVERFADRTLADCQARSIREADLRFTVSQVARRDVLSGFGEDSVVVGNGVRRERFAWADPERILAWGRRLRGERFSLAAAADDVAARPRRRAPVVLAVGGVEPRKNTLAIVGAFTRLRAFHPDAELWILGGATVLDHGTYRAEFDAARAALPAPTRDAIVELGVLPEADVPAVFQLADVLALPSLQEGFGLVALEALAAGLPVVASAQPPFTEFLDSRCATLVDPRDEAAIAAGLRAALRPSASRRAAGWRRAAAHSWAAVAARHADSYERIVTHARDALRRSLA